MFEPLARRDIERMRAAGYCPTDDDVVRLNELAAALARGKDTTAANHPRFAFAGETVLHEPTVGALQWWWSFGHDACVAPRNQLRVYCFMLAHSRQLDVLRALETPGDIMRAVRRWERGVAATDNELLRAMLHVRHGEDSELFDPPKKAMEPSEQLDRINRLVMLAAGTVGVRPEDIRTETESALYSLIAAACKAGTPIKPSTARLYMAYQQTIRDIEARGKHGDE